MNTEELNSLSEDLRELEDQLLESKGADYTRHDPDRLANFKRSAQALGTEPLLVWAIYANKHWDAIMSYVSTGKAESEDIKLRFVDLKNYLTLGYALIYEKLEEEREVPF
jgi:hypothetical protein